MTFDYAAATGAAFSAGTVIGAAVISIAGLVLLTVGTRKRSAARRPPAGWQQPPANPPQPYPPQYPDQGYPAPPQPKSSQPKSSGTALIIVGVVLLSVGGLGLRWAAPNLTEKLMGKGKPTSNLSVGDCVSADAWSASVTRIEDVKRTDCSSPDGLELLAAKANNSGPCPDGKSEHDSVYDQLVVGSLRLCFELNVVQGHCYLVDPHGSPPVAAADCATQPPSGSTKVLVRVARRVDGSTDTSVCPSDTQGEPYPQPARTYCFEGVSAG